MRQHAAEHTAMYWLLLATHPDGCFEPSYERVVKYRKEIKALLAFSIDFGLFLARLIRGGVGGEPGI